MRKRGLRLDKIPHIEIGMSAFPTTQGHCHPEDDILAQIDGDSAAKALVHLGNVEVTPMKHHLTRIVSEQEPKVSADGADDSRLAGLASLTHFPVILGFYG